jgi:hypothetical protein
MASIYETIDRPGIRSPHGDDAVHKSSYIMTRQSENALPPARPYSVGATAGSSSLYESSYLKKLQQNPAPSIAKSSSFASTANIMPFTPLSSQMYQTTGGASKSNNRTTPLAQSHSFQRTFPPIQTSISINSHQSSTRHPPSPSETINAILMEETNSPAPSPSTPKGHTSMTYSPPNASWRRQASPSPERLTSYTQRINTSAALDENLAKPDNQSTFQMGRNASPPPHVRYNQSSYDSESSPPPRPKKPLSPSHKDNIKTTYNWAANKLPHEERYNMALNNNDQSQRQSQSKKYMPTASYRQAPFWTQVSVKVSAALLKAGKDRKLAEAAQIAVVQAGEEQYSTDQEALNFVASRASLAVIEAGGDASTAAIATVACIQANSDVPSTEGQFKNEIERVMANMKSKASEVVQTTYDGGAKAVNVLSEFATRGIKDIQSFSDKSYRQYRTFQRRYMRDRERALRKLDDVYRDSRDDGYIDRVRSRGSSRRRNVSRARSAGRQRSSSRPRSATTGRQRSSSRARASSTSLSRRQTRSSRSGTPPPIGRQRSSSRARTSRVERYDSDDSYEYSRRRRSYSKSGSESFSDSESSVSSSSSGSSTYSSSSESIKHSRRTSNRNLRKKIDRPKSGGTKYRQSLSSSASR